VPVPLVALAPSLPPHAELPAPRTALHLADDDRLARTASAFRAFLASLDLDLDDPNLVGTDFRVARAYRELFAGLAPGAEPTLSTFPNSEGYADIVSVVGIPFFSLCAHHFLPFFGTAHVGYIPGRELLGLSKFARVVDYYARRPQLQERLTQQIAELLDARLEPAGVIVVIEARHLCMEMRGIGAPGVTTRTVAARGALLDATLRNRFLAEVRDAGFTAQARGGAS
jgi:GTP cyclohydrolase I